MEEILGFCLTVNCPYLPADPYLPDHSLDTFLKETNFIASAWRDEVVGGLKNGRLVLNEWLDVIHPASEALDIASAGNSQGGKLEESQDLRICEPLHQRAGILIYIALLPDTHHTLRAWS